MSEPPAKQHEETKCTQSPKGQQVAKLCQFRAGGMHSLAQVYVHHPVVAISIWIRGACAAAAGAATSDPVPALASRWSWADPPSVRPSRARSTSWDLPPVP